MPNLTSNLELPRCPHCAVASPNLSRIHHFDTNGHDKANKRVWGIYVCGRCGGVVTASANNHGKPIGEYHPSTSEVDIEIPDRPKQFLQQAVESLHAPAGAQLLCASSVDAMLKEKGYMDGSLYARIEQAAADHLITDEMARWAHEVRLDANDQRHADQEAAMPTQQDAKRVVDFTTALAQFLFVLPAKVSQGLQEANE